MIVAPHRAPRQNGGMFVSIETITTVISGVSLLLAFFGAFGWMIHRTDGQLHTLRTEMVDQNTATRTELSARIDKSETELGARIDRVETELGARIDRVETELGARIDRVETEFGGIRGEIVELKIAIARLEGPPQRLITTR
ncbi:MAG: response regulator [Microbacterium sp.]